MAWCLVKRKQRDNFTFALFYVIETVSVIQHDAMSAIFAVDFALILKTLNTVANKCMHFSYRFFK